MSAIRTKRLKVGQRLRFPGRPALIQFQNFDDRPNRQEFEIEDVAFIEGVRGIDIPGIVLATHHERYYLGSPAMEGVLRQPDSIPLAWKAFPSIGFVGTTFKYRVSRGAEVEFAYLCLKHNGERWLMDYANIESSAWQDFKIAHIPLVK